VRKLKFVFPALFAVVSFASLFSVSSCKKTYTTVVQDSIYYSPWIPFKMTYDSRDTLYFQDFPTKKLTAKVISSGVVLGYGGFPAGGDTVIQSLSELTALYGVQQILWPDTIEVQSLSDLSYSANSGLLYRYVIIPGNVLATTSLKDMSHDQLSKMKFTDIQQAIKNPALGVSTGQGNSLH
jgi:hypothetical protein